jgi:hypothetical protein
MKIQGGFEVSLSVHAARDVRMRKAVWKVLSARSAPLDDRQRIPQLETYTKSDRNSSPARQACSSVSG